MSDQANKTRMLPDEDASTQEKQLSATPELDSLPVKPQERYKFLRSIGFGGMKAVLLVHDLDTDREVAMAMMPDFRERPPADLERFVREAKLTAGLEHPNIIPVHDIGKDSSGSPYFTMKYLRGTALSTVLRRLGGHNQKTVESFNLQKLLRIYLRICNAITFAHSHNVCHLDLKPENIIVGAYGEVIVLDWGLACKTDDNGNAVMPPDWRRKGTPGFMPPEQIATDPRFPLGKHSDIYSLGALLYSFLTLSAPGAGAGGIEEQLRLTVTGQLPPPSAVAPEGRTIPAALEAICLKAMALAPANRYSSAEAIGKDIIAFQNGYAPVAENASALRRSSLFISRNLALLLIVFLALAVILLVLFIWWKH